MVGSPIDDFWLSPLVNLDEVNRRLEWNPLPIDYQFRFDNLPCLPSPSPIADLSALQNKPYNQNKRFSNALQRARTNANHLTAFEEGRTIIENEPSPDQWRQQSCYYDNKFWNARADYYLAECIRLTKVIESSQTLTPYCVHPRFFGPSELDQAKGHAQNAANILDTIPAGKAYLREESHEECTDEPQYWKDKEKLYKELYQSLSEEWRTTRAKQRVISKAERLAAFPEGRELLKGEDYSAQPHDAQFWEQKETLYRIAHERLRKKFWSRQRLKYGRACATPEDPLPLSRVAANVAGLEALETLDNSKVDKSLEDNACSSETDLGFWNSLVVPQDFMCSSPRWHCFSRS